MASRHHHSKTALVAVILCIGVMTLTPGVADTASMAGTSVFARITCLTCSHAWLADAFSNVALFVPFGAALVVCGTSLRRAALVGAAASLLIELLQLSGLVAGRTPAIADLVSNTLGTLIGGVCVRHARACLSPTAPLARALRNGWATLSVATWITIAIALQPATPIQPRATVSVSGLPFTPGYGWFAAEPLRARVNGASITHQGNGPVLVAMPRADSTTARVTVRGRDRRSGIVPVMFVHDPAMTSSDPLMTRAHLLLAQHDRSASLSSDLRAAHWGLMSPELLVRDAFTRGRDSVQLEAAVTTRGWHLSWLSPSEASRRHEASQRLSPAIGWALLQSTVSASARFGVLVTAVWLFMWFAPLGFWSASASHSANIPHDPQVAAIITAAAWSGALLAVSWGVALATGTSPLSVGEAAWCLLSGVASAALQSLAPPALLHHVTAVGQAGSD